MSLRSFARLRGCSLFAVQTAIRDGRLTSASVAYDLKGQPVITDVVRASQEWAAHTRPRLTAHAGNGTGRGSLGPLAHATVRERLARAEAFEFETARKKREFVRAGEVEIRWSTLVVAARTALLGIPSRYRARLPHLTGADVAVLDGLIRETLAELADGAPPHSSSSKRSQEETP